MKAIRLGLGTALMGAFLLSTSLVWAEAPTGAVSPLVTAQKMSSTENPLVPPSNETVGMINPASDKGVPIAPQGVAGKDFPRKAVSAEFDPVKNPRVYEISKELRCLVCQNESIAESNADLAIDLRREVIRLVNEGKSNDEVIQYMTDRYGDYVLYKPPFKAKTYLLWLGPLGFILIGCWILVGVVRRRKTGLDNAESPSYQEALRWVRAREYDEHASDGVNQE